MFLVATDSMLDGAEQVTEPLLGTPQLFLGARLVRINAECTDDNPLIWLVTCSYSSAPSSEVGDGYTFGWDPAAPEPTPREVSIADLRAEMAKDLQAELAGVGIAFDAEGKFRVLQRG